MDGVRMTPQDPSKKKNIFFSAKLIGWGGPIRVDDAGAYLQMDGCTHPDLSIWTHPVRCSKPIHIDSSRRHPILSRIKSVAFEDGCMCDSDVTTEDDVPQTVAAVAVHGTLLL